MPFIYDNASLSPISTVSSQHIQHHRHPPNKMPFLGGLLSRKKSNKTGNVDGTASTISELSLSSQSPARSMSIGKIIPTRRPANPPTVANPFTRKHSSSEDAPPCYTAPAPIIAPSTDNPYAFLAEFDTIFLIDDSGSMAGSSWRETSLALGQITPICTSQDKDGIDIYFLNAPDSPSHKNITRASKVQEIFSKVKPGGGTPTGRRLNAILKPYLQECEAKKDNLDSVKPLNIIVITDGIATDDPESVIFSAANKLDKLEAPMWQVGIQFFQVGEDPTAKAMLESLDDGLVDLGCKRDIVDTVPWRGSGGVGLNATGILKVVLGAVNRRLDRTRVSLEGRPGH